MRPRYSGSCLCGSIRFDVTGPFDGFYLCYCKHCQKDSGSAHAASLFLPPSNIFWHCGQELLTTYRLPGSLHQKSFCQQCGSPVPSLDNQHSFLMVPAGCLDTPILQTPDAKIFVSRQVQWSKGIHHLVEFDELPKGKT